jgi:putative transposase
MKISVMCRVLGVSTSGYYDWLKRVSGPPSKRAAQEISLLQEITLIHQRFTYYGSPRVQRELRKHQILAGRHRVARIMRVYGLHARRGKPKDRPRSAPPVRRAEVRDKVRQQFVAPGPNRLWFTDLTIISTGQGRLYAAVILDCFNREVISWAVADHETPSTAMNALDDAITVRRPHKGCIIHSDRGYQFTSQEWANLAAKAGLVLSIGERKNPRDNAVMESWFGSYKNEELYPKGTPSSVAEARMRLFRYIHEYNTERMHSTLGYLSPTEYAKINK